MFSEQFTFKVVQTTGLSKLQSHHTNHKNKALDDLFFVQLVNEPRNCSNLLSNNG